MTKSKALGVAIFTPLLFVTFSLCYQFLPACMSICPIPKSVTCFSLNLQALQTASNFRHLSTAGFTVASTSQSRHSADFPVSSTSTEFHSIFIISMTGSLRLQGFIKRSDLRRPLAKHNLNEVRIRSRTRDAAAGEVASSLSSKTSLVICRKLLVSNIVTLL